MRKSMSCLNQYKAWEARDSATCCGDAMGAIFRSTLIFKNSLILCLLCISDVMLFILRHLSPLFFFFSWSLCRPRIPTVQASYSEYRFDPIRSLCAATCKSIGSSPQPASSACRVDLRLLLLLLLHGGTISPKVQQ